MAAAQRAAPVASSNHVGGVAPMPNSRTPATPGSRASARRVAAGSGSPGSTMQTLTNRSGAVATASTT